MIGNMCINIGIWFLSKVFPYVSIHWNNDPDREDYEMVSAIIFSVDEATINMFSIRKEWNK